MSEAGHRRADTGWRFGSAIGLALWVGLWTALAGMIHGCDGRSRARADGTDTPLDAGRLDGAVADATRGGDRGLPVEDADPREPPDAAARDAVPDAALPDAVLPDTSQPDAAPPAEPDLIRRATQHAGGSSCPQLSPPLDGRPWSMAALVSTRPGSEASGHFVRTPIRLVDGPGIPEYESARGGTARALRWVGHALFGWWTSVRQSHVGPVMHGEWTDIGLEAYGLGDIAPGAAFDAAAGPGGETAIVFPTEDALVLYIDRGTDAEPQIRRWPVPDLPYGATSRLVVDTQGVLLGWTHAGTLTLYALDFDGGERWRAELPVADDGFDLAVRVDGGGALHLGLVHIGADPRLADVPYGQGYGQPLFSAVDRVTGAILQTAPLHPGVVRAEDPAIGARDDGWMTAWVRLRVDGDRNRTEIEGSRVGPDGPERPLRITRAHGFSFCPDVGDAVDGVSVVAWLDTRSGAEEILTAHGDFADWPDRDVPEPTPPPAPFPDGCEAWTTAIDGPVATFDAVASGDGFRAVWTDQEGRLAAGFIDPVDGATVRWRVDDAAPGGGVRIARSGETDYLMLLGGDASARVWRGGPDPAEPGVPEPIDFALRPPMFAFVGGPAGVIAVGVDDEFEAAVSRVDVPAAPFRLPPSNIDYGASATADGFVVARHTHHEPGDATAIEWLPLPADPAGWPAARWQRIDVPGLGGAVRLSPDPSGWRALLGGDYGRFFARVVLRFDPGATPDLRRLDIDPASSDRAALHADGAVWIEQRPIERYAVHFAAADGGPVVRLPVPAGPRTRLYLNVVDGDPVVLWRAGVDVRITRVAPGCRLPAASTP